MTSRAGRMGVGLGSLLSLVMLSPPVLAQPSDPHQIVVPPAPLVVAAPDAPLPPPDIATPQAPEPGLVRVQPPPALPTPSLPTPSSSASSSAATPDIAGLPPAANNWHSRTVAVLAALNEEDGAVTRLRVKVGSTFTRDKLQVAVKACVVRPKGEIPDAAVFLSVNETDKHNQSKNLFRGWLVQSEPGAAVVANATVSFQVLGCAPR